MTKLAWGDTKMWSLPVTLRIYTMMITRDQLASWADTPESKANFPYLISRLIRATTAKDTKVDIPWGSATYIEGWDGIVNSKEEARYILEGISLWELAQAKIQRRRQIPTMKSVQKILLDILLRMLHSSLSPRGNGGGKIRGLRGEKRRISGRM